MAILKIRFKLMVLFCWLHNSCIWGYVYLRPLHNQRILSYFKLATQSGRLYGCSVTLPLGAGGVQPPAIHIKLYSKNIINFYSMQRKYNSINLYLKSFHADHHTHSH